MKLERKLAARPPIPPLRAFTEQLLQTIGKTFGKALRKRIGRTPRAQPRLELVERIALAPRQSLALVEAEGRLLLIATSADGGPAFYPLGPGPERVPQPRSRVSW